MDWVDKGHCNFLSAFSHFHRLKCILLTFYFCFYLLLNDSSGYCRFGSFEVRSMSQISSGLSMGLPVVPTPIVILIGKEIFSFITSCFFLLRILSFSGGKYIWNHFNDDYEWKIYATTLGSIIRRLKVRFHEMIRYQIISGRILRNL